MPKDDKATRPPSYQAKLSQIRGVSAEEKALLQRVGNLIDVLTFAQRQNQNPRGQRRQLSSAVPIPANVIVTPSTGGIQVSWDPIDVSELDFYEVQVSGTATFALSDNFQVIDTSIAYRARTASGALFLRIRAVLKRGQVSEWSSTSTVDLYGTAIFQVDQDHIEPENRTTVSPKPTLIGDLFQVGSGNRALVGVGAYVGPSPLTFSDNQPAFPSNVLLRHEISYNLHDIDFPYPGIEQRYAPTIGEYIDADGFYTYVPSFYMYMSCMPASITDFFVETDLDETRGTLQLEVEFLRYAARNDFYDPQFAQTGYVFNAEMANIKF